mmetsp:Transcript_1882/g.3745  ORF Transcript_1882/g.3745 Transcript_1882/m.3745 type:complete len:278 (-) Transcript_1882:21-854(-)
MPGMREDDDEMDAEAGKDADSGIINSDVLDTLLTRVFPIAFVCMVVSMALAAYVYGIERVAAAIFSAVDANKEHRVMQAVVINSLLTTTITLCLPGPVLLIILNGFFFGFFVGFPLTFVAEFIAALLTFLIARSCFKQPIRAYLMKKEMVREVVLACEEDDRGMMLVLFRFLGIPIWIKNYTLAILDISLLTYVLVYIPAAIMFGSIFTFIGSKAYLVGDELRKGNFGAVFDGTSGFEVALAGSSGVALILLAVLGWHEFVKRQADIDETSRLMPAA